VSPAAFALRTYATMLELLGLSFVALTAAQSPFSISNWSGAFDSDSGVLQSLKPALDPTFDFSPSDVFSSRNGVGNYHTGDVTLRWRSEGQSAWKEIDTAAQRATGPTSTNSSDSLLSSSFSGLTANYTESLNVTRNWREDGGDLVLQVTIANPNKESTVELGAFGFPIEFNNIFTGRDAIETSEKCVLVDPYIGLDAGYLQVTRLFGTGPAMVITPYGNSSKFEAWRFLHEPSLSPLYYQSQTFEGHYAWQMLSKAYAENEWSGTEPWNDATSEMLQPGQNVTFVLKFSPVEDIPSIESTVASTDTPLAIGIPGYTLTSDMVGRLFVKSNSDIVSITSKPDGALTFTKSGAKNTAWKAYDVVSDGSLGRVHVDITYDDGKLQTVHYYLSDAAPEQIAKHARFLFKDQWMSEPDAFGRSPGIITYDWGNKTKVEQDYRVWIAGLQDEGGAASYVAAALKTAFHPIAEEVHKLEEMATTTIWGNMQYNTSDGDWPMYTVKRSLFYYDPEAQPDYPYNQAFNWSTWASWNKTEASQVWRPYNYVWVSALYWALYHAEQVSPGVLTLQNSSWYLEQASHTAQVWYGNTTDGELISDFRDVGFMGETVWLELLKDLEYENMTAASDSLRAIMQDRQAVWAGREDPFGSEMAWDSTGQEGVYLWSKYAQVESISSWAPADSLLQILPRRPHSTKDTRVHPWLHADRRPLGLEWQRPSLLGLQRSRRHTSDRATGPPLRLSFERDSPHGPLSV
jgi:hypothetical protein